MGLRTLALAAIMGGALMLTGCGKGEAPKAEDAPKPAGNAKPAPAGGKLYTVQDGKVDEKTLEGWRTWRAAACERCHGPNQEGMVGPSLIESLKTLSKDDFNATVLKGRSEKGMPNFDGSKQVVDNLDNLYAYLKGRSDGAIPTGKLTAIGS